ncbi:MAG: hypothetical protein R3E87_07165 [Burkholderiaceae bacterium]
MLSMIRSLLNLTLATMLLLPALAVAAQDLSGLREIQSEWARISYDLDENRRADAFEALATRSQKLADQNPDSPEALTWHGIVLSSWAGARGGLGALKLVEQAKTLYEQAIAINASSLGGSAVGSLGVLYHKVPGWPLAFGSDRKAKIFLERAVTINPTGIDSNYFYGEFLYDTDRAQDAVAFLERALAAPPRPGRESADAGRRREVEVLLAKAKAAAR